MNNFQKPFITDNSTSLGGKTMDEVLDLLKVDPSVMKDIPEDKQTDYFLQKAAKVNPASLPFVAKQTDHICKAFILSDLDFNTGALRNVRYQTHSIVSFALGLNGMWLEHVREQTEELRTIAVRQNPHAIAYANVHDIKVTAMALNLDQGVEIYLR